MSSVCAQDMGHEDTVMICRLYISMSGLHETLAQNELSLQDPSSQRPSIVDCQLRVNSPQVIDAEVSSNPRGKNNLPLSFFRTRFGRGDIWVLTVDMCDRDSIDGVAIMIFA